MRRLPLAALTLATALGLAGCGGIPTAGPVEVGGLIDEDTTPDFGYLPPGPQPDAEPAEIVSGFIQAATNPQNDFEVAREFLDAEVASEWKPNEITQIRSGVGSSRANDDGTYTFSFTSSSYVDASGRYIEEPSSTQSLTFSLAQDADEQWRITDAPDGIVLSTESFTTIFEKHALYYFYGSSFEFLVPDVRWFPRSTLLSTSLVRALLAGQSNWLGSGVTNSEFPTGTTLESRVIVDGGVATVELSEEAATAEPASRARMRDQLVTTLEVSTVVMTVNGVELEVPDTDGAPTIEPTVQGQLLAMTEDGFGYLGAGGTLTRVDGQSAQVEALSPTAATIAPDRAFTAVLGGDGVVYRVPPDDGPAIAVDRRPGLAAPAADAQGYLWSIPTGDASAIRVSDASGATTTVSSPIAAGTSLTGFALSRDGSRIALSVRSATGPEVLVFGILRNGDLPTQLGEPLGPLAVDPTLVQRGVTWVDGRTIATLASSPMTGLATVTTIELGGRSELAGRVADGVAIVGGNGGVDGLRVMTSTGEVFRPRGNGWSSTTRVVSFMATQQ